MAKPTPTMISVERGRTLMLAGARALGTESVELSTFATGQGPRVNASAAYAAWPLPNADLSTMDGFAVRAAELQGAPEGLLALQPHESAAGRPAAAALAPACALAISTGAVLPEGADMVVPIEDTQAIEASEAFSQGALKFADDAIARARSGRFVRAMGSEVAEGALLLDPGLVVGPAELALLAAAGQTHLELRLQPRVAVISTGDELVAPGQQPARGQVVSTNALMLRHQIHACGGVYAGTFAAGDTLAQTRTALEAAGAADLVLTTGGLSVGRHDHVWPALEALGAKAVFRKIKLRPGKPTSFARLGSAAVLCLPGNPASAYVAFELFGRPYVQALAGQRSLGLPRARVRLGSELRAEDTRDHYVRASYAGGRAHPLTTQVSGALPSISQAQLLLVLPAGAGVLAEGCEVDALRLPGGEL